MYALFEQPGSLHRMGATLAVASGLDTMRTLRQTRNTLTHRMRVNHQSLRAGYSAESQRHVVMLIDTRFSRKAP
jgi:hypothetical protein